ncbi:hypothetical protein GCM10011380_19670 [Sphingomonas metalli]|uniref:site-specific DNA-methyltransferase (adenine-specific) n=1 Tax=Sphingomonas metalli TaxID=1779358 RepID=A0A916T3B6_9SPHN|nr:hypothetical protein GCM10011380_19670 [Sphingomonas metalli]
MNRRGRFNVPRGTKTAIVLPDDDFHGVAQLLKGVELDARDFEESIDEANAGDVVFCDPPYTVAHNMNGFVKYNQTMFSWEDQRRLASALRRADKRDVAVVMTNADHHDLRCLYSDFANMVAVGRASVIAGAVAGRRQTTELLVTNDVAQRRLEASNCE